MRQALLSYALIACLVGGGMFAVGAVAFPARSKPPILPIGGAKAAWHIGTDKYAFGFAVWYSGRELKAACRLQRTREGKTVDIKLDSAEAYFPALEPESAPAPAPMQAKVTQ